jgi:hypothetical protein
MAAGAISTRAANRTDVSEDPRTVVYDGVAVPSVESEVGRDYKPDREAACGDALCRHAERGDEVVVVGGGRGLTTVIAARMTHFEGSVTVYESNSTMLETLRRTIEVNRVADLVTTVHAAIGSVSEQAEELFGPGDGERLDPSALPECDVLEMDCEGAELAAPKYVSVERPKTFASPSQISVRPRLYSSAVSTSSIRSCGIEPRFSVMRCSIETVRIWLQSATESSRSAHSSAETSTSNG